MKTSRILHGLVVIATVVCVLLALPSVAWAKEYSMGPVSIDATLAADGSLRVVEDRTFDFDGSFNGVYWKLPCGEVEGRSIEPVVESCGIVQGGQVDEFTESYEGGNGTFQLTPYSTYTQVKLYNRVSDRRVTYRIVYVLPDLATAWHDTGELYWKFVSDGWDEPVDDVTCRIHLPVPAGQTVEPEKNVRAWGHGTLDGEVLFAGDDVVFTVPRVGTSDFAEARITFPVDWLTVAPSTQDRMTDILAEEQQWADEANAKRTAVRVGQAAVAAVSALPFVLSVVLALVSSHRYRSAHRPVFQDTYFRDVPTNDHPAVLGAVYHQGDVTSREFTATLMHVSDLGAVDLNLVQAPKGGRFGAEREDYQLVRNDRRAEQLKSPIDRALMTMLFEDVAPKAKGYGRGRDGEVTLDFSDIEGVARAYPETYTEAYERWQHKVEGVATERGFFTDTSRWGKGWLVGAIVLDSLGFMLSIFLAVMFEPPAWVWLFVPLPLLGLVPPIVALVRLQPLSPEAVEVRAQLEALRRWLKDFTRLNEAVPSDVVLWNRLLVMAVVLGVAKEVVAQLQVALPQMLEDPAFMPTYVWVSGHGRMQAPSTAFTSAAAASYQASHAAVAASSNSSGGGGGGGFSGGGGGGFGGGGGGGAF